MRFLRRHREAADHLAEDWQPRLYGRIIVVALLIAYVVAFIFENTKDVRDGGAWNELEGVCDPLPHAASTPTAQSATTRREIAEQTKRLPILPPLAEPISKIDRPTIGSPVMSESDLTEANSSRSERVSARAQLG